MAEIPGQPEFPDTLQGFGYGFNKDGKLRKLHPDTNEPGDEGFEFKVSNDQETNQRHYETLGEVITKYVYELLEAECDLHKLDVPAMDERNKDQNLRSFIFVSKDALTNPERLLILIHGSGVVRAGQWARSLIINDSLKTGSQLPYIHRATELGYGVMVLNTNDNKRTINGRTRKIKHSEDPQKHAEYVWENYVKKAKARHIAIVAHSYGGVVVMDLFQQYFDDFRKRVVAIALTDSVHFFNKPNSKITYFLQKVARNWVSSSEPLDSPIDTSHKDVARVSAGTPTHEQTSANCLTSVFAFVQGRLHQAQQAEAQVGSEGEGSPWRRLFSWMPRL